VCFCTALANGNGNGNGVLVDTASDDGKQEIISNAENSKVLSAESDLHLSDRNACLSVDEEDSNSVLFNGDIVCSEHGEISVKFCLCYTSVSRIYTVGQ